MSIDGEDLSLTYDRLLEDSRCPEDVQCIWAGNGRIGLTVARAGGAPGSIELSTTLDPKSAVYEGFTVSLVELARGEAPAATLSVARS